jgi:hypothetical protein
VYAQSTSDPWDNAVTVLKTAFTGTIANALSLVAIVVGGLMFAYGEGQSKKTIAGIVFGVGMAVGAVKFLTDGANEQFRRAHWQDAKTGMKRSLDYPSDGRRCQTTFVFNVYQLCVLNVDLGNSGDQFGRKIG